MGLMVSAGLHIRRRVQSPEAPTIIQGGKNMRNTRAKLDMHSEVTRRNNDRDIAHAEWLFQLNHLPDALSR